MTLHYVRRGRWRDTAEGRAFSLCFCCGFLSLFFFPTRGYPVEHTFPCWAQDWPQSSDHLTAVCPMQKPLTTDFQHFMHQYPSACTLGEYFCPATVDQLWLRAIHIDIYIYIYLPSNWEQPHFSNEIWIQTLGTRSFFLCLFLPCILSLIPKVFFRVLFIQLPSYK